MNAGDGGKIGVVDIGRSAIVGIHKTMLLQICNGGLLAKQRSRGVDDACIGGYVCTLDNRMESNKSLAFNGIRFEIRTPVMLCYIVKKLRLTQDPSETRVDHSQL